MSATGIPVQVCASCGARYFPPHLSCASCGGTKWTEMHSFAGTVRTITVSRRRAGASETQPVMIGLICTDAGPVVVARCEGSLSEGQAVELSSDGLIPVARART